MMPLARFNFPIDDASLVKKISPVIQPLHDLGAMPSVTACLRLSEKLKTVFVPTTQILNLLRTFILIANEHADKYYADERAYIQRMYSTDLDINTWAPTCLTGLAGTGKSEVLAALRLLLSDHGEIVSAPGLPPVPMRLMWAMRMWSDPTLTDLLSPMLGPASTYEGLKSAGLIKAVARRMYASGVSLASVDEFQFVTQSGEAHTKAAKMLMQLSRTGPPLLYVGNFSLLHKLQKRPQEERHRLLSNVLALHPDHADSEDWKNTLKGQIDVAPEEFDIDHLCDAAALHQYSFGIKRLTADLFVRAYARMRETGAGAVRLAHIEWAYKSPGYTPYREDVEALTKQAIENRCIRKDLWCPIALESPRTNVIPVLPAIQAFDDRVNQEMLRSSLLPGERKIYDQVVEKVKSPKRKPATVFSIKRTKLTKENLLDGMAALRDQLNSDREK
jgi:hypothetical protein